jgi:hypothetical protein
MLRKKEEIKIKNKMTTRTRHDDMTICLKWNENELNWIYVTRILNISMQKNSLILWNYILYDEAKFNCFRGCQRCMYDYLKRNVFSARHPSTLYKKSVCVAGTLL